MGLNRTMAALMAVIVVAAILVRTTEGQDIVPGCAINLVPCVDYININLNTKPPSSCCDPLTEAVVSELSCMCSLYKTPSFFDSFLINFTEAIRLPSLCGIATDLTTCTQGERNKTSSCIPPISSGPPTNDHDSSPEPPTDDDDGSTKKNEKQASENNSNVGNELSMIILSLVLFWTSVILY